MTLRNLSRRAATFAAAALVTVPALVTVSFVAAPEDNAPAVAAHDHGAHDHGAHDHTVCHGEVIKGMVPGEPDSCAHADQAPPGVDVTKRASTADLETRQGAAAAAVAAAEAEGVPAAAELAAVTDRVPCDGDGTSGYRVQAVYVVSADVPNRFASVGDQIKQWAAGVNSVYNLSAAKTGGVRDVRFVTSTNGDGTCSPTVLNVTLPAGSNVSFNSTITAMSNAGYTSPARKYLMWVDGTGYCGIARTYLTSAPGQDNPNNGTYPGYARIDTQCWGGGGSVEAHELSHTMGSVQGDAPHATKAGHCWDESDRMCYNDGSGIAMQQVCAGDQEVLFDCNNDDYYSTYPAAGTYLATHWNTANSRFLIGGGDGVGGGTLGVPTTLGGTMSINNPGVPGLATLVSANLEVPAGRTTQTLWSTSRADCVFGDKTANQTSITCDARLTGSAPVTLTVTDDTGAKMVRTSAVTFNATARTAQGALSVDTSTASTYTACPTGKAILSATITDQSSGAPIKGVTVAWLRQVGATTPVQVATAVTGVNGVATSVPVAMSAGKYTAKTTALTTFPSVTSAATDVTVAGSACTTTLTGTVNTTATQAGQPVTVTGLLTRTLPNGTSAPAAGERVTIYSQATGATTWAIATSATTAANGSYTATVKPLTSVSLQARFAARTGFGGSTAPARAVTVSPWATSLTVNTSTSDLMAGAPVTVTGTLTQSDGTITTPMTGTPVTVTYPIAGGKTAYVTATTNTTGGYTAVVKPTGSGTVTVRYAGKPGWPAATTTAALTVHGWATTLTASPSTTNLMAGAPVTITGTLTQSDGTTTTNMTGTPVTVTYPIAGGKTTTASTTTTSTGRYSLVIRPVVGGTVTVRYAGKAGWDPASATATLTVNNWTSALTLTGARNASTGLVTATGYLMVTDNAGHTIPKGSATIAVTYQYTALKTATVNVTTDSTGKFTVSVRPGTTGNVTARYAGTTGWAAATSPALPITVP